MPAAISAEDSPTMARAHRWLTTESASNLYDSVEFQSNGLYNEPAPEPWVAFVIGGIFFVLALVLWVRRVYKLQKYIGKDKLRASVRIRCYLTAYIDNDDAYYTIAKMASQSFIFLGGLQLKYNWTFSLMLVFFTVESCCDSLRTLLSFFGSKDLNDVIVASKEVRAELRKHPLTVLEPSNVYEDLTRGPLIVTMVFFTQIILISFVVITVFDTKTINCFDGSSGCPVTGTFGSWMLYVLGIFMACVYLLGPNTNFGMSEQNPAFWLQLLLSAKNSGNKITWYNPAKDRTESSMLRKGDLKIWIRFLMSFVINGVGFHILVHALPIQVAGQSSLFSVVFRAVGMMYLVDLDDTPGYKMTLVPKEDENTSTTEKSSTNAEITESKESFEDPEDKETNGLLDAGEMAVLAQQIIEEAQEKLNALSSGRRAQSSRGAALFMAASPVVEVEDGDIVT